mmetsp:Transcript_9570/g.39176  ORF Transcript_9570/g.39176 Transcript_9570/m.39176 type:complete len:114 (+) Transcript_9570:191-532(+)
MSFFVISLPCPAPQVSRLLRRVRVDARTPAMNAATFLPGIESACTRRWDSDASLAPIEASSPLACLITQPHATIERCRTRDGVFDRHRASDFDSQDIADAVAVANVGGAARRK